MDFRQLKEQAQKEGLSWAIKGVLALISAVAVWLWGWFAASGLQKVLGTIPSGAVVAFAKECPKELGWTPFEEGTNRVIVGAGDAYAPGFENWYHDIGGDNNKQAIPLKASSGQFKLLSQGGELWHNIRIDQIPPHDHKIQTHRAQNMQGANDYILDEYIGRDNPNVDPKRNTIVYSEKSGDGQKLYLIPPYISLNLCKKT